MKSNFEVKGVGAICREMERIAKLCVRHYQTKCATSLEGYPIVVTLMSPGTQRTNASVLGHFTLNKMWVNRRGKRYHEIAVNPHVLLTLSKEDLVDTIYHEVIHLHCLANGVGDTSGNGRHNRRFAKAANLSGMIEAYDTGEWMGYTTRLTREGMEWVSQVVRPRPIGLSRILTKSNGNGAATPKRVKLVCKKCDTSAMVAAGKWRDGKIMLAYLMDMTVLTKG